MAIPGTGYPATTEKRSPLNLDAAIDDGLDAIGGGREETAIERLEAFVRQSPNNPLMWQVLALLHRAAQNSRAAINAFDRAAAMAPTDAKIVHGLAQVSYEGGLPSVALFQRALALAPANLEIVQGLIGATLADLGPQEALAFAETVVRARPLWLAGHWALSRLRFANGQKDRATESIEQALATRPAQPQLLWNHWLFTLMKGEQFAAALNLLPQARNALGRLPYLDLLEAYLLSETGSQDSADILYRRSESPPPDVGFAIHRIRHELRMGRPAAAAEQAGAWLGSSEEQHVYPYLSIAWRLLGDPRWEALEKRDGLVATYDLRAGIADFDRLVGLVRSMHNQKGQPLEQSLRGGTQTDAPLLLRIDPEIEELKQAILKAARHHISNLPDPVADHPQLSWARDFPPRVAASWSVRFRGSGHHAGHVHPAGWFSSALYLEVPETLGKEDGGDGWLMLGQPHELLNIALPPIRKVRPEPGHLTLFPSTMWHGTNPFTSGERLTIAFDLALPSERVAAF